MIWIAALALAAARPTMAAEIRVFCRQEPKCAAEQMDAVHHFLGRSAMYEAPPAVEERCMRAGRIGHHVNWLVAYACIRDWSKGRDTIVARKLKG